ncbi:MAG: LacI family DNA-binding transcriptional regulator [Spirochaetales bacterium]|nr:LacI family DNA-binding transcriptional regulator [Spirochaetales bacterium]
MVTLKDVAHRAGVSEGTASLALNRRPGVKEMTRRRVLAVAEEMGYSPNRIARSLAMRKTHTVGLVVTDIENPFFGSVTRFIHEYVRQAGYTLILSVSNDDSQLEDAILSTFISNRVEGAIIVPTVSFRQDFRPFEALRAHRIPVVFATASYPGYPADCVMTDLEEGSYRLTRYLIELGHRNILLLASYDLKMGQSALRVAGYQKAFSEIGIRPDPGAVVRCKHPDYYNGYSMTREVLKRGLPDAITAINDVLALGSRKALQEQGLRIPADISVAGYDDLIFSSLSQSPLTTVRQAIPQICRESVSLLMDRIHGDASPVRLVKIAPELIVRESTGACRRRSTAAQLM